MQESLKSAGAERAFASPVQLFLVPGGALDEAAGSSPFSHEAGITIRFGCVMACGNCARKPPVGSAL